MPDDEKPTVLVAVRAENIDRDDLEDGAEFEPCSDCGETVMVSDANHNMSGDQIPLDDIDEYICDVCFMQKESPGAAA